jgi:hypothetical protein
MFRRLDPGHGRAAWKLGNKGIAYVAEILNANLAGKEAIRR